jgi:glycine/D-amino acid oxidase-like deaminating enzyme
MARNWGAPPWTIDFAPAARPLPPEVDFAVVGGGFTGLAAAAWLRRIAPQRSVALLEAERLGAGASGRTGGLALGETAAGDLPGLGDVLGGYRETLKELGVDGGLDFRGVYEIGREDGRADSPIAWEDSGTLRVVREVAGGGVDPGKVVGGLGRAAERLGAVILERTRVESVEFRSPAIVHTGRGVLRAGRVLLATNAQSAQLAALEERSWARFTLAVATEPLAAADLAALGLAAGKGFYTVDLPYLWGRPLPGGSVILGSGLVDYGDDAGLAALDVFRGAGADGFASLEGRVRRLHPSLAKVRFERRWGGPIRFGDSWELFFDHHPRSGDVLIVNGLGGDGVSLSVYLGRWAAEALAGLRELPAWGKIPVTH